MCKKKNQCYNIDLPIFSVIIITKKQFLSFFNNSFLNFTLKLIKVLGYKDKVFLSGGGGGKKYGLKNQIVLNKKQKIKKYENKKKQKTRLPTKEECLQIG